MSIPTHLSHWPIIGVENYDEVDGVHAKDSDAKAIAVGFAQYNEEHISAKVFRHSGEKWSRQSEELPLHRAFDLSTLILKSILESGGIETSQTASIETTVVDEQYLKEIANFYTAHRAEILPKIQELQTVINYFTCHEPSIAATDKKR